jgi:hypothetical protein
MLLLFSVTSCINEDMQETDAGEKIFYDVNGFIETQISELDSLRPQVHKTVSMGNEHNVVNTKDVNWEKELGLFVQADINKPAFKQSYHIARPDSATFLYTSKEGDKLPVRDIKVVLDETGNPSVIEAHIKSENKLYVSEKHILLKVSDNRIQGYQVTGFQKLIMMDKKPFSIAASVSY